MAIETLSEAAAHGGVQGVYRHRSAATGTDMTFAVFLPPQAAKGPCPVVTYLSGLTCTHANVLEKGEYRRAAAEHGLIVVCPDTSPRGAEVADDPAWDLGQGAGFYLDATEAPWASHFRMETYVAEELSELTAARFPVRSGSAGILGHSMGGHGALTLALKRPGQFRSCSAFAPIVAPSQVPWGQKAFAAYLGANRDGWREHDAVAMIDDGARFPEFLVDVGQGDIYLERELRPELLQTACAAAKLPLTLRMHERYDHSYYFVSTFMDDHLRWHAERLKPD